MTDTRPQPVERDSRGILDPLVLQQRVRLTRHAVPQPLSGLIDRFWAVEWEFGPGESFRQDVLTHPGANISVATGPDGAPSALLNGVSRSMVSRELTGTGWAVAAMTRPGGLGPFVRESAVAYNDRVLPVGEVTDLDGPRLVADMVGDTGGDTMAAGDRAAVDVPARAAILAAALVEALARAEPRRVAGALEVTAVARRAETDRTLSRVDDLAAVAGLRVRTLQRMFRKYAGVSPTWVLRRYRLIDAAELVRSGQAVSWAEVADELGYADQAHLVRDFRATLGRTPAEYAAQVAASGAVPTASTRR